MRDKVHSVEIHQRQMLAAILHELHKPLVIDTVLLPKELVYGQVLVKVKHSSICGSQIGEINGVKGEDRYLPHLLGHEGTGIVEEVGPGVGSVKPGDTVVLHWKKGEGCEAQPPRYTWREKPLNAGWLTTFNEYAVVSENRTTKISSEIDLEQAALLGCAVTTGFGIVANDAQVKFGESVLVLGAGGVGLNEIQGAKMLSAYPIIAVDLYDRKLALAKKFGATHTINSSSCDVKEEVKKILGSSGADVVIENTGNVEMIEIAYELSKSKGRSILVGVPKKGHKARLFSLPLHFGKVLKGSHGGDSNPSVDIPRYIKLMQAGKLSLEGLITHRFVFREVNTAIQQMQSGEVTGRCCLSF